MKIGIVVNPASGGYGRHRIWPALRQSLVAQFAGIKFFETEGTGDAARYARALSDAGSDLVVAVGGDGTIGEAVDGILTSDRPETPFAFVPGGTGADFARNFSFPQSPEAIVTALVNAPVRAVDVGRLSCLDDDGRAFTRHFINIASLGLSGPTVRAVNKARRDRRTPGSRQFLYHSVVELLRYRADKVRVLIDDEDVHEGPITVVAVANGRWFGGGMKVAPAADIADGLFDVVVIRAASKPTILRLMNRIYSGAHVSHPLVSIHRGRRVEVLPADESKGRLALIDCDGEGPGTVPATFEVLPGALRLKI
ncbi:diacylglycerol kinase family lipid kinase [Rhizobiaceae bacterium n13]|uniref:Diacylglycerol kinase family lipid kinase n=1 Tax=Ferirhizobium litorale TaxID=2927786 RepID=A0AAE3Q988_9HYPH|nr:diacylglycerol kinase family lipid kinase [Fererhizobium litorale]MDI7861410.1 diacylglycerol kinase family lipid kinase [Fererhizobium litorale]MDI7921557.1 diacylglycerol kinase family lipid kinase [Fererhizobium litorale]